MNIKKIGILFAMDEEGEVLKPHFQQLKQLNMPPYEIIQCAFQDKEVYLVNMGIGKVNAAIATILLIERHAPDLILNVGIAGTLKDNVKIGDVLVTDSGVYCDVDVTLFGYQHGQVPRMPPYYKAVQPVELPKTAFDFAIHKGTLCTSDSFLPKDDELKAIHQLFPDAAAIDMEGAAVAQACHQFKKPFVMIKGISNAINDSCAEDSEAHVQTAMMNAVMGMLAVLENLISSSYLERRCKTEN